MADANAVIQSLGAQLAQALIAKTVAEVEVAELRQKVIAAGLDVDVPVGTAGEA